VTVFDRFRAFSQGRQIMLVALGVAAIGALLGVIWLFFLHTTYQPLFTGLRTSDAATIVADLDRRKVPYRLGDGGGTILVPADIVDTTRLSVMSEDLPLKGTVGFELFNKADMGITDFAQKINYQRALQGELERTIMTLDGVDTARVHLSLGEDRIFRDDRVPPKASVTVRMAKGATLSQGSAQGVRRLVAAAVPNLDIANVVVLDEEGRVISAALQAPPNTETASPVSEERHAIEQYYQAHIRQAFITAHLTATIGVSVWISAANESQAEPGLTGWTPATRAFPLEVTLSPAVALDAAAQDFVRTLAAGAIGSGPAQDDVIAFGDMPQAPYRVPADARPAADATPVSRPPASLMPVEDDHDWLWEAGLTLALVLFVLVGFLAALWRLRSPRRLTERQREAFALRLRDILEKGDGHAASHP
jgi:flagellar M-ring protein FliF